MTLVPPIGFPCWAGWLALKFLNLGVSVGDKVGKKKKRGKSMMHAMLLSSTSSYSKFKRVFDIWALLNLSNV